MTTKLERIARASAAHGKRMKSTRTRIRRAFRDVLGKSNGVILYEGPSTGNGDPIVVVATGIKRRTTNRKTDDMVQIWILRQDMSPQEAWHKGLDAGSNCPVECIHRSPASGGKGSCYLELYNAPRAVWQAWKDGSYSYLPEEDWSYAEPGKNRDRFFAGLTVRFGAYGDPGMVPAEVWSFRHVLKSYTGYTARWSALSTGDHGIPHMQWQWLTASVPTVADALRARSKGWRYFRAKAEGSPDMEGEQPCPAVGDEPLPCALCTACDGSERASKRPSRTIEVHGAMAKSFEQWADGQEVTA